jgi:hypothetical protein
MSQADARPWPGDNDHEGQHAYAPADLDAPTQSTGPLDDIKSGIKAWADIGLSIGESIDAQTRSWSQLMARLQHSTPIFKRLSASGVYPASGDLVLVFGTPDQGTIWEVKNVVIGGADFNTSATGSAGLYVGAFVPQQNAPNPGGITNGVDYSTTLPKVATYSAGQVVVNDQEYLYAVIFSGTATQQYAAAMMAVVTPQDAAAGRDVVQL